jgi:hypothetical protein
MWFVNFNSYVNYLKNSGQYLREFCVWREGKEHLSRSFILMHSQIFEVLWEGERAYFEVRAFVIESSRIAREVQGKAREAEA